MLERTSPKRMKLSSRARYALRSMIVIARQSNGGKPVALDQVARATQISKRYLEQLAIALKNAMLLRGVSGKAGGYLLVRPAGEIKIGQIIEAAIGPINIVDCVRDPTVCLMVDVCECRLIYVLLNCRITQVLNEFSLADLADQDRLKRISRELTPFDLCDQVAGTLPERSPCPES